jgi:hypothetical protein
VNRLPHPEQLAKEMAEFCKQVIKSATDPTPPAIAVVSIALAGPSLNGTDKAKSFWSSAV